MSSSFIPLKICFLIALSSEAAAVMATQPGAIQIRTLQTIRDIAQDPSEKIVVFMPSELGEGLAKLTKKK